MKWLPSAQWKMRQCELLSGWAALNCTVTHETMRAMIHKRDTAGSEHDLDNILDNFAFMHLCQFASKLG